jgi:hypothetical protein
LTGCWIRPRNQCSSVKAETVGRLCGLNRALIDSEQPQLLP